MEDRKTRDKTFRPILVYGAEERRGIIKRELYSMNQGGPIYLQVYNRYHCARHNSVFLLGQINLCALYFLFKR